MLRRDLKKNLKSALGAILSRMDGEVFAIWEWMFGTLVLPSEEIRKNLFLGVGIGAPQRHPTLAKVDLEPLASMMKFLPAVSNPRA